MKDTNMFMPFGKYKGTRVCDLPSDYLKWLAENITEKGSEIQKKVCLAADKEYQLRITAGEL